MKLLKPFGLVLSWVRNNELLNAKSFISLMLLTFLLLLLLFQISHIMSLSVTAYYQSVYEPKAFDASYLFSIYFASIGLTLFILNQLKNLVGKLSKNELVGIAFLSMVPLAVVFSGYTFLKSEMNRLENIYTKRCPIFESFENTNELISLLKEHNETILNNQVLLNKITVYIDSAENEKRDYSCLEDGELELIKFELIKALAKID